MRTSPKIIASGILALFVGCASKQVDQSGKTIWASGHGEMQAYVAEGLSVDQVAARAFGPMPVNFLGHPSCENSDCSASLDAQGFGVWTFDATRAKLGCRVSSVHVYEVGTNVYTGSLTKSKVGKSDAYSAAFSKLDGEILTEIGESEGGHKKFATEFVVPSEPWGVRLTDRDGKSAKDANEVQHPGADIAAIGIEVTCG